MDLLNFCLTSTYFQYNGKHYKQLHSTAMGSPVSVVVAEIVMQNIEESALPTRRQVYYIEAIYSTLFGITDVLTEKSLSYSWFTRVLPKSCMGFYAGKPIESVVYCLYKQPSAGNNLRFIICLHHNSVKWIKHWQIQIGMVAFKNFF